MKNLRLILILMFCLSLFFVIGCSDDDDDEEEPMIHAAFTAVPTNGNSPLEVTFTDVSTAEHTTIENWEWDFDGDGTIDMTGAGPHNYTYTEKGTYTATLKVSDAEVFDETTETITVTVVATTISFFTFKSGVERGVQAELIDLVTDTRAETDCIDSDLLQICSADTFFAFGYLYPIDSLYILYETWTDMDAYTAHTSTSHYTDFMNNNQDNFAIDPEIIKYEMVTVPAYPDLSEATITVVSVIKANPDSVNVVKDNLVNLVYPTREEPGCVGYDLNQGVNNENIFTLYENWLDGSAINYHLGTDHFITYWGSMNANADDYFTDPLGLNICQRVIQPVF